MSYQRSDHIAILGAGPIGLEAALAAVEAGKSFTLYETAPHAAGNVRQWGHVRLFTPWHMNVSPRMQRHLTAAGLAVPEGDNCPTGDELADCLLEPIASLPEVAPHLRAATRVLAVGRQGLLKHEEIGSAERAERPFRLVVRSSDGAERVESAGTVLDCTGTYASPNALGNGGIPAPGEAAAAPYILRHIPNPSDKPETWAGKTLLVVGAGHSAQGAVCDLAAFALEYPGTRVLWALRRRAPRWHIDPDDPLPERSALSARAADLAAGTNPHVEVICGVIVESIRRSGEGVEVELVRDDGTHHRVEADLVVSLTGYVGDATLYRQLQVHECYATSGPMKLAAALQGGSSDCLAQECHGADTLTNPEPGFFILGIKSYGRTSGFLMRIGWSQVDEVFKSIELKVES